MKFYLLVSVFLVVTFADVGSFSFIDIAFFVIFCFPDYRKSMVFNAQAQTQNLIVVLSYVRKLNVHQDTQASFRKVNAVKRVNVIAAPSSAVLSDVHLAIYQ